MSVAELSRTKVACTCGKKYVVKSEFAGRRVRCSCGEIFEIPSIEEIDEPAEEQRCFMCEAPIGEGKEVCSKCDGEETKEDLTEDDEEKVPTEWWNSDQVFYTGVICLLIIIGVSLAQTQIDGWNFLKLYLGLGFACIFGCLFARFQSLCWSAVFMFVLSYEAIGAIRYLYGTFQGMSNFGLLFRMMLIGPCLCMMCFLDYSSSGSGGGSSWSSIGSCGSSGGSSCGGGCGGGGCGGCGG